jgi:hypothetical protein
MGNCCCSGTKSQDESINLVLDSIADRKASERVHLLEKKRVFFSFNTPSPRTTDAPRLIPLQGDGFSRAVSRVFHPKCDVADSVFDGLFDKDARTISKTSVERFFRETQAGWHFSLNGWIPVFSLFFSLTIFCSHSTSW